MDNIKKVAVRYEYTDLELSDMKDELAGSVELLQKATELKKSVMREHKENIDTIREKMFQLGQKINAKSETRQVECIRKIDRTAGVVNMVDAATGELVGTENLTAMDRQTEIGEE